MTRQLLCWLPIIMCMCACLFHIITCAWKVNASACICLPNSPNYMIVPLQQSNTLRTPFYCDSAGCKMWGWLYDFLRTTICLQESVWQCKSFFCARISPCENCLIFIFCLRYILYLYSLETFWVLRALAVMMSLSTFDLSTFSMYC